MVLSSKRLNEFLSQPVSGENAGLAVFAGSVRQQGIPAVDMAGQPVMFRS